MPMLLPEQLHLDFSSPSRGSADASAIAEQARELVRAAGAPQLADKLVVEWDLRLRTAAGRADYRHLRVSLNPRLREHGAAEIDRTLRHELAHLLAKARAGRRPIQPHGPEWSAACRDLGIAGELRCHTLPFPIQHRARRLLYRCRACGRDFPRVRPFKRRTACLACCRAHN
ncbi:MAG: SprT-like domain-containing protein, partial [Chthoniobacterales bacterium]|nr:SprT-like domain-containing protein [Chthoniobacterales bacterium]